MDSPPQRLCKYQLLSALTLTSLKARTIWFGALLLPLGACSPKPPTVVPTAVHPTEAPTQLAPSRVRPPTPERLVLSYLSDRRQTNREAPHVVVCTPGWGGSPREGGVTSSRHIIASSLTVDTLCRVPVVALADTANGLLLLRFSFEPDTARVIAEHVQARWPQSWYEEYIWSNLRPVHNWSLRFWGFNPAHD